MKLTSNYEDHNVWNADEAPFSPYTTPDRGLASRKMSGKKRNKFRITALFACNSDGSERMEPLFIGKFAKPRCFMKRDPSSMGIYYRSNKKAWMTSAIFEEYETHFSSSILSNVILDTLKSSIQKCAERNDISF